VGRHDANCLPTRSLSATCARLPRSSPCRTKNLTSSQYRLVPGALAALALLLGSSASLGQFTETTTEANATGASWKIGAEWPAQVPREDL